MSELNFGELNRYVYLNSINDYKLGVGDMEKIS